MNTNDLDRKRLGELLETEKTIFCSQNPVSMQMAKEARSRYLGSVPMPWMARWPGPFPIFIDRAKGATCVDVDGNEYVDLCLGDTGAMTGHSLKKVRRVLNRQLQRGLTTMLPSRDAIWVGNELQRRFGLPKWQIAMTATDANRFVLRIARHVTKRPKVAVIDWCYHGTVDESLVVCGADGEALSRPGAIGPQVDPKITTRVVQFNDLVDLEHVLSQGDVAVLLMEPALTNIGIVLPDPGYLEGVRKITRRYGVLLAIDETHTICVGSGGATSVWSLEPDFFIIGKPIAGGIPAAAYGMSDEIASKLEEEINSHEIDVSGIGGTLTGSALAMSAIRATLTNSLRDEDFAITVPLAASWANGVQETINEFELSWSVQQLGSRAEYWFCAPPSNGADAASAGDPELENYFHLYALNRGVMLTPFHNMALFSPFHTCRQVEKHSQIFRDAVNALFN